MSCNCTPTTPVDPCNVQPIATNNVSYSGPNLSCTGINTCDTVTVAFEKVNEEICDLQSELIALQNLVNSLTTTTTTSTTSSTTTTTTTILCPSCTFYSVTNENITPVEVVYYACGGFYNTAIVGSFSTIYICACTGTVVIPPLPGVSSADLGVCPTTTTTTTLI